MIDIEHARTVKGVCDRRGGVTSSSVFSADQPPWYDGERYDGTGWKVTLRYQGRQMVVPFWQGSFHVGEPETSGVLSCVLIDADLGERSFAEFCGDLGYNEDSRKDYKLWQECRKVAERLRRFLGDDFRHFQTLEQD